jgi:hypothetical protein
LLDIGIVKTHLFAAFQDVFNVLVGRFKDHFLFLRQLWSISKQILQFAAQHHSP